jgi:hypothetical protein
MRHIFLITITSFEALVVLIKLFFTANLIILFYLLLKQQIEQNYHIPENQFPEYSVYIYLRNVFKLFF